MIKTLLPYLAHPLTIAEKLDRPDLLIVCLGSRSNYLTGHLPGAVHLEPSYLSKGGKPAPGLLPTVTTVEQVFRRIGLQANLHVVCYDDDAGTRAARMMWLLDAMGHRHRTFLDGGLTSWNRHNLALEKNPRVRRPSNWFARPNPSVLADKAYVLASLNNPDIQILDARSPEEHQGLKSAAARLGRIPGAINLNWLDTISENRHFKSPNALVSMLLQRGFHKDREIIAHCQTHQRSSHSYVMLRSLGFRQVRGYAGSWSEWAADDSMPIE